MARLSLGNFGNLVAQSATPTQVASGFSGIFEGGMNALQTQSNIINEEFQQKEQEASERQAIVREQLEEKKRMLNDEAQNLQDIEQAQRLELTADINEYKNIAERNMIELEDSIAKGLVQPEEYQAKLQELNDSQKQNILSKWEGTGFSNQSKDMLSAFDGGISNKALERENAFVRDKSYAQLNRALDNIRINSDSPEDKIVAAADLINASSHSQQDKQALISKFRESAVDEYWKYEISNDSSLLTLEAKKEAINNAPITLEKKAVFLNMIEQQMNQIESTIKANDRLIDYEKKTEMAEIADQITKGATVSAEQLQMFEQGINSGLYEKNPTTKIRYERLYNTYDSIQKMKQGTLQENQAIINQLKTEALTKTGDDALKLIDKANMMQSILNKTESAVRNDGITQYSIDTGEPIPMMDISDINSLKERANYAMKVEAKYGIPTSIFTEDEQVAISEKFKYLPVNDVVNIISVIGANTQNDKTLNSITKQPDNKQYYKYAVSFIKGGQPDGLNSGRAIINGGRLLDNVDGKGVVLDKLNVLTPLDSDFRTKYGAFFEGNPQLMGTYIDSLKYAYANEVGKGSDFAPVSYDDNLFDPSVNILGAQTEFNGMDVIAPRAYIGREEEFEADLRKNILAIFSKDGSNAESIATESSIFPLQGGYGLLYGGEILTYPGTTTPIKIKVD